MRPIIVLSHFFPFPPNVGAEKRISFVIKMLSSLTEVVLIAQESGLSDLEEAKKYCSLVFTIKNNNGLTSRLIHRLKEPFVSFPSCGRHLRIDEFKRILYSLPQKYNDGLIWLEAIWLIEALEKQEKRIIVLDQHNLDSSVLKRRYLNALFPFKILYYIDFLKQKKYEIENIQRTKKIFSVSKEEKEKHKTLFNIENVDILPNVIDFEKYNKLKPNYEEKTILMTGDFGYEPNIEGLKYFIKNIFPKVKKEIKEVKVFVAGKNSKKVKIDESQIVLYGEFDEPKEVYVKAYLSIAPILTGGGSRYKIIESLAMGIPVVSTLEGAEGLEISSEEGVFIASDSDDFAKKIVALFNDKELAEQAGTKGRKVVEERFSFSSVKSNFVKSVLEIVA